MAISQNFPTIQPTLNLNFARSKRLDPRITFTRSSSATRTNAQGLIETVSANVPRFDHSINPTTGTVTSLGLLIEESRTNLLTYSEQIDQWTGIVNVSVSPNVSATTSPNGSLTADKLIETATTGGHNIQQGSISKSANAILTFTVFAKSAERTWMGLTINDDVNGFVNRYGAEFDLASGIASEHDPAQGTYTNGSFAITPYPNGWYRCRITCTTSTESLSRVRIFTLQSSAQWTSASSYTGDGTSGIYIWGAQLEVGSFSTSYIPTAASQVTRSVDNASITGTNFSSWYNQSEGTLVATARSSNLTSSTFPDIAVINDGTNNNRHIFAYINASLGGAIIDTAGVRQVEIYPSVSTNPRKGSFSYKLDDFATSWNGQAVSTDTSVSIPTVDRMQIGDMSTGLSTLYNLNGTISQLIYYPKRLTNSQLQSLTR